MSEMDTRIPEPVRDIFAGLRSEFIEINARWIMYRQLYGVGPERVELLNESAGTFFNQLQWVLLNDTVLALSRLTDPSESFGRENLVLAQLFDRLDPELHRDLIQKLKEHLTEVANRCAPFRTIRNRRVAHADLLTALKIDPDPLPGITREMVEKALESIQEFMNKFEYCFCGSTMLYRHTVTNSDGEALIWQLKRASDWRDGVADGTIPKDRSFRMRQRRA